MLGICAVCRHSANSSLSSATATSILQRRLVKKLVAVFRQLEVRLFAFDFITMQWVF